MLLDHTMNIHFLSPLQWHTVLTSFSRIPVHPWSHPGLLWFSINGQNNWLTLMAKPVFQVLRSLISHRWKCVQVESVSTVYHHMWIRKSAFMVWFSINGQNTDLPLWHNRFSRCWGVFWSLVEHLSWAKVCPSGISHHSVLLCYYSGLKCV